MEKIIDIAVRLVHARRSKIKARLDRNVLLNICRNDSAPGQTCYELQDELCEICQEAAKINKQYQYQRTRVKDLLRQLEKAVQKEEFNNEGKKDGHD